MKKIFILALSAFFSVQACPYHSYEVHYADQKGKHHAISVDSSIAYEAISDYPVLVMLLVKDYGAVRSTIHKADEIVDKANKRCEKPAITEESLKKIAPLNEESNLWIYAKSPNGMQRMMDVDRDLPYWEPEVQEDMVKNLLNIYGKNIVDSSILFVENLPKNIQDREGLLGRTNYRIIEDPAGFFKRFGKNEQEFGTKGDYVYFSQSGVVSRAFVGLKGQDNSAKKKQVEENIIKFFNFAKE